MTKLICLDIINSMKKYTKDEILKFYVAGYKICHDSWVHGEYIYMTKKGIENYSTLGDNDLLKFMEDHDVGWSLFEKQEILFN